jgi:hypothetical protein
MKRQRKKRSVRFWIAVRVWRGFPSEVAAYRDKQRAFKLNAKWRCKMNPDYDDTGVFRVSLR